MALKYTEEQLNGFDKETVIQLFLSQQEQLKQKKEIQVYTQKSG